MRINFLAFLGLVFLFGCSRAEKKLPAIYIKVETEIPKNKKIPCEIIYVENRDSLFAKATIKRRGGSSMKYKKHSYRVELESKIPLANLPSDDDWILTANYIDKTMMRHKISYDLFRKMHSENLVAQSSYIEVYLNGNYNGLYLLMEKIDASTTFLKKEDPEAMLFKDPPIFFEKRLEKVQEPDNYFQQKVPKKKKLDQTKHLENFHQFLFKSTDENFQKEISKRVNLRNIIDWHLLLLFSNNSDGIMKNFYLLKRDSASPLEIVPWDYDHSFGRDGDNELNMLRHELDVNRSVLFRRLNASLEYRKKLKKRYWKLRKNGLFSIENFSKMIRENDEIIEDKVIRNFEKWKVDGYWYFDDKDYQSELELMEKFVKIRLKSLDDFFKKSK